MTTPCCPGYPHEHRASSQAGLQALIHRVPGPTVTAAAARPSVTDNARTESAWIEWAQDVTGAYVTTTEEARQQIEGLVSGLMELTGMDRAAGRAETTTEWGVRSTDTGAPYQRHDEEDARHVAARQGWAVVRREVTAWTEADR